MAAPNTVPSKLVINTLRGVLFTTSCSVVLLAEERRRRINIARAAVENAKKLHTAKVNRGAIALGDGYISWDGRLLDANDEILATMPIRSARRRRTSTTQDFTDAAPSSKQNAVTASNSDHARHAANAAAARAAIRQPIFPSSPTHTFQNERLKISQKAEVSTTAVNSSTAVAASISNDASPSLPTVESNSMTITKTERVALYKEALPILDNLLRGAKMESNSTGITEDLQVCHTILEQLASIGKPTGSWGQRLHRVSLESLEIAAQKSPDLVEPLLVTAASLSKNSDKMLASYLSHLLSQNDETGLKQLSKLLCQPESTRRISEQSLAGVFKRLAKLGRSPLEAKRAFEQLREAGIFQVGGRSIETEYQTRRQLVLHAKAAKDFNSILLQESSLDAVRKAALTDVELQGAFAVSDASTGNMEASRRRMYALLSDAHPTSKEVKQLASEVTDVMAKNQTAPELEAWIRDIISDFQLPLQTRWARAVLNGYKGDALAMQSWVDFCAEHDVILSRHTQLQYNVVRQLRNDNGDTQAAAALIDEAHARGEDISEAMTSLLMAQLKEGHDANKILHQATTRGVRIHDSVYNSAAQQLAAQGDFMGAAKVCKLAARENGEGHLAYSEYNFSNLVYTYTGCARYDALHSILTEFRDAQVGWQGSKICKESIKLAMKTAAQRSTIHGQSSPHYRALLDLDATLCHVQRCRAINASRAGKAASGAVRVTVPTTESKSCGLEAQQRLPEKNLLADGL